MKVSSSVVSNIIGSVVPLAAGILAFPILFDSLGPERFGVLSLIWVIVGYFGFFDLGIGRALTYSYSKELAKPQESRSFGLLKSGLLGLLVLGCIGGLLMWSLASVITQYGAFSDLAVVDETIDAFKVISVCIPFLLLTNGGFAILEAEGRFLEINLLKSPLGALLYLTPVFAWSLSPSLVSVAISILAIRIVFCIAVVFRAVFKLRNELNTARASTGQTLDLFQYGRWIALSYLIGPLMLYGDRFVVAGTISMESTGVYVVVAETMTKLLILPSAIISVYFPRLSREAASSSVRLSLQKEAIKANLFIVTLPILAAMFFGGQVLSLWFAKQFTADVNTVIQILSFGILFNSFGLIFQSFVQADGRPDLTAKLHVAEFLLYVPYLICFSSVFGMVGVALAWSVRTLISAVALCYLSFTQSKDSFDEKF